MHDMHAKHTNTNETSEDTKETAKDTKRDLKSSTLARPKGEVDDVTVTACASAS